MNLNLEHGRKPLTVPSNERVLVDQLTSLPFSENFRSPLLYLIWETFSEEKVEASSLDSSAKAEILVGDPLANCLVMDREANLLSMLLPAVNLPLVDHPLDSDPDLEDSSVEDQVVEVP